MAETQSTIPGFLGLGTGILTQDKLDLYREMMEKGSVVPIQKNMEKNLEKQKNLTELITLVDDFNSKIKKFADSSTYLKRKGTVTGDGVTATIGTGVLEQDIKIQVHQLAKNDVTQFGKKFESRDSVFSTQNTTLNFNHNGKDYTIDIRAGQTLAEVSQAITDATDGEVAGVIMKTGGSQPYQLMVQSKDTGEGNRVYFGNTMTSGTLTGGKIKGEFELTLKDSNGKDKKLTINLDTPSTNTTQDNATAVKKAIEEAINKDADLKGLYEKGQINVGLVNDGKGFVINDSRGYDITIAGEDSKLLEHAGLKAGTTSFGSDAFTSGTVQGGDFSGKITIGNVEINLADVTKKENSAQQNLDALVAKINADSKGEYIAEAKNGRLVVNSKEGSAVQVVFDQGNSAAQNAKIVSGLGISAGNHIASQDYLKEAGITKIQTAQDSKFSWNGIEISRPTNTIDDVVSGINVELTKEHKDTESSLVKISSDDDEIFEGVDEFIEAYNALVTKVEELTRYDEDTKIAGIFNGESSIRGIQTTLKGILDFTAGSSGSKGISHYGITIDDNGKLTIDKEKLKQAYKDNKEDAMAFFMGGEIIIGGTEIEVKPGEFQRIGGIKTNVKGFFVQFKEAVDALVGKDGTLKTYEQSLKNEYKKDEEDKKSQQERVDSRINGLKERFIAYDGMMAKMQSQMQQLQNMMNVGSK